MSTANTATRFLVMRSSMWLSVMKLGGVWPTRAVKIR
jgi:hypothetical protein